MIDTVAEKKFLLLKKRLDALHYCQPFTVESASLIDRLLNDLIKTTEGFQSIKKSNEELKNNTNKAELRLEPLKKENARLMKENNELHYEMIQVKEQSEFRENRWNNTFKSLEGDKVDLKHVLQLRDTNYTRLEEENLALKKKIELILKKQYAGGSRNLENNPAEANKMGADGRGVKFEITRSLDPNEVEGGLEDLKKGQSEDNKIWADNLRKAEERVESLREELKNASATKATFEEKIRQLEIQVGNRDREVKRLQAKMDVGDVTTEKLSTEYSLRTNSEKIERLNSQIDFLTKENFGLEDMMKDMKKDMSRTDHVRTQNRELEGRVKEMLRENEDLRATIQNSEKILEKTRRTKALAESEIVESKNKEIDVLENEIGRLTNTLDILSSENSKLKMQSSHAGQTLSAYNSDKLAFSETLQILKEDKDAIELQLENLKADLRRKVQENESLAENLNLTQGRVQTLQREVDLFKQNMTKNTEDQSYTQEITATLRGRITELENENISLNSQRNELELQLERSNRLRDHVEEQLERIKEEALKSKSNVSAVSTDKQRFQMLYEEALKDIEFIKRDNRGLEAKLLDEKRSNNDLDIRCNDYFNDLKSAQEKIKDLERDIELMKDQVSLKLQEVRRSESLRTDIEREFMALKGSNTKLEDQMEKNKRLREDMKRLEEERISVMKKVDELTLEVRDYKMKEARHDEILRKEREANEALSGKIEMLATESENFDLSLMKVREREQEYNRALIEIEGLRNKEREFMEENERLKKENRKHESLMSSGSRQVEHLIHQKDEQANEIKQLREEISTLRSSDNEVKTKSIKLQEKVNNFEIMIADLKDERVKDEARITEYEDKMSQSRNELDRERRRNTELSDQVHQLKTLADSLENTRKELLERLQNKNNERSLEEGERMKLQDEIKRLRERAGSLEKEMEEMRSAVMEVDRERDNLQEQLDEKTEVFERMKRKYEDQEEELRRLKERSSEFLASNDMQVNRMHELEEQLKDLHRRSKGLMEENNELKKLVGAKDNDVSNLVNDLNILTRENQNLNQKIQILVEEKERVKDALGNTNMQEKMMKQTLRATELEKEDILSNYKAVCAENDRLKRNNDELTSDNQEFFRGLKENEREIMFLKGELQQSEIKESQFMNELAAYERNVNMLNRRLEQADSMVREGHDAKERLLRDLSQIQQMSEGIEYSKDDVQRKLVNCEQERTILLQEIKEARIELDMLRQQVDFERRRFQDIESVLTEERKAQYRNSIDIQNLENEKIELQLTVDDCQKRIRDLQNNMSREMDLDSFHTGGAGGTSQEVSNMQRTIMQLERDLGEKKIEVRNLQREQEGLREENSKQKLAMYRLEDQKNESNRFNYQDSASKSSYERPISEQNSSSKAYSDVGWDKLKMESETFKKNLEEASLSSKYLKEKVKSLQMDYKEFLPDTKFKKNY